ALGSLEVRPDGGRAAQRLPSGLGDQLPNNRCSFARDVPEPILVTRLVLTRNKPEIAADGFGMAKAVRIIHECRHRFGRANTHSGGPPRWGAGGRWLPWAIQLLFKASPLADRRLDFFEQETPPQWLRSRGQDQLTQPGQPLLGPQTGLLWWDDAGAAKERGRS